MRAPSVRPPSRHALSLLLCAGVLALSGCPKMPRITNVDPSASTSPTTSSTPQTRLSPSPTPTSPASPTPALSPTPNDEPVMFNMTVGHYPQAVAIDPGSGEGFVALSNDFLYVTQAKGDLQTAKPSSMKAPGDFDVGSPTDIVRIGNVTWYVDKSLKLIRKINSREIGGKEDFSFGQAPFRLVTDSQDLWIADGTGRQVAALRGDAFEGSDSPVASPLLPGEPTDLLIDHAGNAWVATTRSGGGSVHVTQLKKDGARANLTSVVVTSETPLSNLLQSEGLAVDLNNDLWLTGLSLEGSGQLLHLQQVEDGSVTPVDSFTLDFTPGRLIIRGNYAWILDRTNHKIYKVSLSDGTIAKSYSLGGRGAAIFKDETGDFWIPLETHSHVVKLDF